MQDARYVQRDLDVQQISVHKVVDEAHTAGVTGVA